MTNRPAQPTPASYALTMAMVAVAAAAAAAPVAVLAGASTRQMVLAVMTVLVGGVAAAAPALFGPRREVGSWGLVVVGVSMGRTLLMIALGLAMGQSGGPAVKPFWVAVVVGAALILIAEAMTSIRILQRLESLRVAAPAAVPAPEHA